MGHAAEILGVPQRFLRSLDAAELLAPGRSEGGHRRYSRNQLRIAARAHELVTAGTALDAACRIIFLEDQLAEGPMPPHRTPTAATQHRTGTRHLTSAQAVARGIYGVHRRMAIPGWRRRSQYSFRVHIGRALLTIASSDTRLRIKRLLRTSRLSRPIPQVESL
ncbi:MerR family transcriptional regulator [Rhodococcus erythropolis]|uniref:MerR family transcriptional regulator n=1 Tax=Rhodococcus erythropolis TaxID=1833 RepID=UPI000B009644